MHAADAYTYVYTYIILCISHEFDCCIRAI